MDKRNSKIIGFNETALGSGTLTGALAPAQSPNEGGNSADQYAAASQSRIHPRLVTRGESFNTNTVVTDETEGELRELFNVNGKAVLISTPLPKVDGEPYAAITDFVNFTFPFKDRQFDDVLYSIIECLGSQFSPIKSLNKGLHGWDNSIQLGETKTLFGYGGQNNTAFLSIPGESCHMVPSWHQLVLLIRDKFDGKITRWDGAVDDYEGKYSVDLAVEYYLAGKFNSGGKMPSCNQKGNWLIPDGSGRTFYVGKSENGKMMRVYEKGMQLGAKWHPWVRWEIELHSVDRVIPFDVLLEPGKYVAGSYPKATGWIQEDMSRIKTVQNTASISYEFMTACTANSYGKHLNVMLEIEGSAEKVLEKLKRDGVPKRLDLPIVDKNEGWEK